MRLAILTQYYPPEIGAPQARLAALARGAVRRGHAVTVLAAKPNYPTGRVYDGYSGLVIREQREGATVVRAPIYATKRADMLPRLASYFSFVGSSLLVGSASIESPDYLLVESPPLFLGITGLWLAWTKSARLIFNVSDLWPESAVRLGMVRPGSLSHRCSAALEAWCYRRAALVTGQTAAIVADIRHRFPAVPVHHLPNGVDTSTFGARAAGTSDRPASDRCTVLYAGLLGLAQGLDQVLDAALALRADDSIHFQFAGEGPCRADLTRRVVTEGIANVQFLDPRPHSEMPALLASADVLVVPLHRSLTDAVPSKLFEALATGRPIVLVATGAAARIVTEAEAGVVVPHDNPGALAAAVRRLAADPALRRRFGDNGRRAAVDRHDRGRIVDEFLALLERNLESDTGGL